MSQKIMNRKFMRREVRRKSEEIGRQIADEILLMPLSKRIGIAFKIIFKRGII
jgi:hypothetical protein